MIGAVMKFVVCQHNDGTTDWYRCFKCQDQEQDQEQEKNYLSRSQCLTALLLARSNQHWWADAHQEIKKVLRAQKYITMEELEACYKNSKMSVFRGLIPQITNSGSVLHTTGSGRTMWEVWRDGSVTISTNRPWKNHVLFTHIKRDGSIENMGSPELTASAEGRHWAEHLKYIQTLVSDWVLSRSDWGQTILENALTHDLSHLRECIAYAPWNTSMHSEETLQNWEESYYELTRRIEDLPFDVSYREFPVREYLELARKLKS